MTSLPRSSEEIDAFCDAAKSVFESAQDAIEIYEFYTRMLKQAVLTHGGKLRIDPALADLAKNEKRRLAFGNGSVELL